MTEFQNILPTEIRLMIWKYVGVAEHRVVAVDHSIVPIKRNIHKRELFVRERPPILLSICQETRQLALSQYSSFFPLPPQAWSYTGLRTWKALNAICRYVGVPNYHGSTNEMERRLTDHVNHHQAKSGVRFSKLVNAAYGWGLVPAPQWFDPAADLFLMKLRFGSQYQAALWQPKRSPEFPKLWKAALVFEYPDYPSRATAFRSLFGNHFRENTGHIPDSSPWHMPELQQINLIVLRNREVFRIEIDDKGLLKPGQWAYSLASSSDDFKEEMASSWSGVLWKVNLAKEEGKCLAQVAVKWAPDFRVWEHHKMEIYRNDEAAFSGTWYTSSSRITSSSYSWVQHTPPEKQLVDGGDGQTYLGVSAI